MKLSASLKAENVFGIWLPILV